MDSDRQILELQEAFVGLEKAVTDVEAALPARTKELSAALDGRVAEISAEARQESEKELRARAAEIRADLTAMVERHMSAARAEAEQAAAVVVRHFGKDEGDKLERTFATQRAQLDEFLLARVTEAADHRKSTGDELVARTLAVRSDLLELVAGHMAQVVEKQTSLQELESTVRGFASDAASTVSAEAVRLHAAETAVVIEALRRELAALPAITPPSEQFSMAESFTGNWDKDTLYTPDQIFTFRGSSYLVLRECRGILPTRQSQMGENAVYGLIAACGAPGKAGTDSPAGAGSGTVTSVSVTTANGVSGTVATATTTPAITIILGAIAPSSVTSTFTGNLTGDVTGNVTGNVTGSSGSTTGNAATVTTNANLTGPVTSTGNATTIGANVVTPAMQTVAGKTKPITFGKDGGGSALTVSTVATAITVDVTGTLIGYDISIDTGTITLKFWKIADGTAIPTIANVINTSGIAISSGTHIRSSTTSDFTTTTFTAGDIVMCAITAVSGATWFNADLRRTVD